MFKIHKFSLFAIFTSIVLLPAFVYGQGLTNEKYFDIRLSNEKHAVKSLKVKLLSKTSKDNNLVEKNSLMRDAQADLAVQVPALNIVQSIETGAPEIIGVNGMARLTAPSQAPAEDIARNFIQFNSWVYGLSPNQAAGLELDADYTNPAGNISWVRLTQKINGLPMFRGDLTFALTPKGEIFRSMGQLAAGLPDAIPAPSPKLSAAEAIMAAAAEIGMQVKAHDLVAMEEAIDGSSAVFERGPFALDTKIELVYFPLGSGAVELAWSMTLWQEIDAYYILVSADDGLLLFNKNITNSQTESATYEVYGNSSAFIDVADSPAPITPGPIDPGVGTQGALLTRQNNILIGNEGPLSFNNNGWITDGANGVDGHTDGNNVEAGLDIDGTNGVDAPVSGTNRVFSTAWNPPPGIPAPGDAPTVQAARDGAVIQMFYITNRYHDALYQLGFTEASFNFQDDNFGRGGVAGDRISAEGQDSSGTNNANFSTPADGGRGRMQMFVFTGTTPNRDGTADADIVIHELTHGTSNRLHGNSSGLGTNMSRGMGEGWGDFYAHAMLSEPTDPINSIFSTGAWSLLNVGTLGTTNSYYGIRRFPKAVMAFTGGPGNLPHNPLTFADLDQLQLDISDGAFPASLAFASTSASQVHAAGEIWSSALWEVRALMITRLGFATGNQRVLQVVTDGMKLAPVNPTFLDERDAIIAAASVFSSADVADVREGFRIRGMGFSAEVTACCGTTTTRVIEAFDYPNVTIASPITWTNMSCTDPNRNPIPEETVTISVPVMNNTGGVVTNVVATANGTSSVFYGDIADGVTVTKDIFYTIPVAAACGSEPSISIVLSSDVGAQLPELVTLPIGESPNTTTYFDNLTLIDLPAGQPGVTSGPADAYPATVAVSGITGPIVAATVTLNDLSHTWADDLDLLLVGPGGQNLVVMSDAFGNTDPIATTVTLDDTAASLIPDGGPLVAGSYQPTNYIAGDLFDLPAPVGPYAEPAPVGAATFASIFGGLSNADVNGDWNLWIDDDAGADFGTLTNGWSLGIVTSSPAGCLTCLIPACVPVLDVSDQTIDTILDINTCQALTSSNFLVVNPGGDVSFTAGTSITLGVGFTVESGATFTAEIAVP